MNTIIFKSTELKTPPQAVFQGGNTSSTNSEAHEITISKDMAKAGFDAVFRDWPHYFKPRNEK